MPPSWNSCKKMWWGLVWYRAGTILNSWLVPLKISKIVFYSVTVMEAPQIFANASHLASFHSRFSLFYAAMVKISRFHAHRYVNGLRDYCCSRFHGLGGPGDPGGSFMYACLSAFSTGSLSTRNRRSLNVNLASVYCVGCSCSGDQSSIWKLRACKLFCELISMEKFHRK